MLLRSAASRWRSPCAQQRSSADSVKSRAASRAAGEGEVVERRHARARIVDLLGEGEAALEVREGGIEVACPGREHAEEVVRLAERPRVAGLLGELARPAGELGGASRVTAVVHGEREVGADARPRGQVGRRLERGLQVRLPADRVSPTELIATWKQRFPEFWPEGNAFYGPLTGIEPGDVALLNMTLPGRMKLSTGVMVLYADEESFTLMTPQGHMFAGWITFSAIERGRETVAQAQVLMRASDPIFEIGLTLGGHKQEDRFWNQTLTALAAHFDTPLAPVDTQVVCVDKKRQWSRWRNVWHSSAIRSTLYMLGAPVRGVKRLLA